MRTRPEVPNGSRGLDQDFHFGIKPVAIPPLADYPTQTVEAGQNIYLQGQPAEVLVVLRKGHIFTKTRVENGKEIGELFKTPSVIGAEALSGAKTYEASATTLDECNVQFIPSTHLPFLPLASRESLFLSEAIRARKRRDLERARRVGADAAVARTLLDLAEGLEPKIENITEGMIAAIVDIDRTTVSRIMTNFQRTGIIRGKQLGSHDLGGRLPTEWNLLQPDYLSIITSQGTTAYKETPQNPKA